LHYFSTSCIINGIGSQQHQQHMHAQALHMHASSVKQLAAASQDHLVLLGALALPPQLKDPR
jgi:hypothetical protein